MLSFALSTRYSGPAGRSCPSYAHKQQTDTYNRHEIDVYIYKIAHLEITVSCSASCPVSASCRGQAHVKTLTKTDIASELNSSTLSHTFYSRYYLFFHYSLQSYSYGSRSHSLTFTILLSKGTTTELGDRNILHLVFFLCSGSRTAFIGACRVFKCANSVKFVCSSDLPCALIPPVSYCAISLAFIGPLW